MDEEIIARVRAKMEATIEKFGWVVQCVFPTVENPGVPFAYTIGLHAKQLPELIVMGLPGKLAHEVVNELARHMIDRQAARLPFGGEVPVSGWCPVHLLEADPTLAEDYATGAYNRSAGRASYLQIVWPDKNDLWPWSPEASESFRLAQPLLGTRSLH